jgi:hypothetical protein
MPGVPTTDLTPVLLIVKLALPLLVVTAVIDIPEPAVGVILVKTRLLFSKISLANNLCSTPMPPITYNACDAVVKDVSVLVIIVLASPLVVMFKLTVASVPVAVIVTAPADVFPVNTNLFALAAPNVLEPVTLMFPPIPTPPVTTSAPEVEPVDSVAVVIEIILLVVAPRLVTL